MERSYLILKVVVLFSLEKCQVIESMGQILFSGSSLCVILDLSQCKKENFALQQNNFSQTVAIDNDGNVCVFAVSGNIPIL